MPATDNERDYAIAVRDQIGRLYGFSGTYGTTSVGDPFEVNDEIASPETAE
jgi:hypothetical protein